MKKNNQNEKKRTRRANGEGSLFRRGNVWWCRIMRKGLLVVKSLGVKVRADGSTEKQQREAAESALYAETAPFRLSSEIDSLIFLKAKIESLMEKRKNVAGVMRSSQRMALKDAGDAYKMAREKDGAGTDTTKVYLHDFEDFVEWAGKDIDISAVSLDMAEMYADKLDKMKIAPSTFNRKIHALANVWKTLGVTGFDGAQNPWSSIKCKKGDSVARDTLTEQELVDIKKATGNKYGGDLRMLIVIGEFTGLRLNDAATLKWSEIDFDKKIICKATTKTGATVYVPVLPEFAKELAAQKDLLAKGISAWTDEDDGLREAKMKKLPAGYDDFVVPRMAVRAGKKRAALSRAVKKVFEEAGVKVDVEVKGSKRKRPLKGFHSLRATWVTRLQTAGIPVQVIMSTVGHANANITQHYTHIKEQEVLAAFEKAGVLGGTKQRTE